MSNKAKKIISGLIKGGFEVVKVSAEQIAGTVSPVPEKLVETAVGTTAPPKKDEFGEYLKGLSDVSPEELEKRQKELSDEEQKELDKTRKVLRAAVPPHMRPREKPPEPRIYDELWKKKKEKEEAIKETRAQQGKLEEPTTVPRRGDWRRGLQKRKATGIETKVNIRTG